MSDRKESQVAGWKVQRENVTVVPNWRNNGELLVITLVLSIFVVLLSACNRPAAEAPKSNVTPPATPPMAMTVAATATQNLTDLTTPTKWEYKVVYWGDSGNLSYTGEYQARALQAFYNSMGRDGWEYVGPVAQEDWMVIFKRPVQ